MNALFKKKNVLVNEVNEIRLEMIWPPRPGFT